MKTQSHPIQPLAKDASGVLRFKENKIVSDLLDLASKHGLSLNDIAVREYSNEDRQQLAQLIGYSLSGYSELRPYVDDAAYAAAEVRAGDSKKSDAEIQRDYYRNELRSLKKAIRKPMARLFEIHPDDLRIS